MTANYARLALLMLGAAACLSPKGDSDVRVTVRGAFVGGAVAPVARDGLSFSGAFGGGAVFGSAGGVTIRGQLRYQPPQGVR